MLRFALLAALGWNAPAMAETLTFEAVNGVHFVRCTEQFDGDASCELIISTDQSLRCIALDVSGKPIAVSFWPGWKVGAKFNAPIDVAAIADVKCEPR